MPRSRRARRFAIQRSIRHSIQRSFRRTRFRRGSPCFHRAPADPPLPVLATESPPAPAPSCGMSLGGSSSGFVGASAEHRASPATRNTTTVAREALLTALLDHLVVGSRPTAAHLRFSSCLNRLFGCGTAFATRARDRSCMRGPRHRWPRAPLRGRDGCAARNRSMGDEPPRAEAVGASVPRTSRANSSMSERLSTRGGVADPTSARRGESSARQ